MSYSTTQGRFLETDPMQYVDGPNEYQYERGNPVNNLDPSGLCTGDFTGGTPTGSTGGLESTWEASKNLYNWLNWKWGSSDDRIIDGVNEYYPRLIRQEPQFEKDRQDFLDKLKKKVDDWLNSNGCKDGKNYVAHSATYTEAIYTPEKWRINPHNWFTGQLTLGRFQLKMSAVATVVVKFDGKNRVTGSANVRIDYGVNDHFDPLGDSDPKKFNNVISWAETGITAPIDCTCCQVGGGGAGGGGGKPVLRYDGLNMPI